MMAIGATHTSEPLVQITTLKVFTNNPGNYSAEKAKLLDKTPIVVLFKFFKMVPKNLPERCLFRFPWPVNRKCRRNLHGPSAKRISHRHDLYINF